MSKENNNAYKQWGKDLGNFKKNWKKSTDWKKKNKKALEQAMKEL
jgi:hypothetical protein